jgi:hypothetical protein
MNATGSIALWRRLLRSFVPGELTVRQWCEQQGVTEHQYFYWRRRVAAAADEETAEGGTSSPHTQVQPWLAVAVVEPAPAPTASGVRNVRITLEAYPGAAIELQPDFDPVLLRAVVQALSAAPC